MYTLERALEGELERHIEICLMANHQFEATLFENTAANGDMIVGVGIASTLGGALGRLTLALESVDGI